MRLTILLLALMLTSCSTFRFPGVHRITIQQGNVVTQEMIDQLRPGMSKSQVRFVLGNAVIDDSLKKDRWDYIYTVQLAGGEMTRKLLSLHFSEDKLTRFEGDYKPTLAGSDS